MNTGCKNREWYRQNVFTSSPQTIHNLRLCGSFQETMIGLLVPFLTTSSCTVSVQLQVRTYCLFNGFVVRTQALQIHIGLQLLVVFKTVCLREREKFCKLTIARPNSCYQTSSDTFDYLIWRGLFQTELHLFWWLSEWHKQETPACNFDPF